LLRSSADDTPAPHDSCVVPLTEFVSDFGDSLLAAVTQQNPPVYDGTFDYRCDAMTENLTRKPFVAQRGVVQAVTRLLVDDGQPGSVVIAEMGTGKTMRAIATAAVLHRCEGYRRFLVISPPHLVYKWRGRFSKPSPVPASRC